MGLSTHFCINVTYSSDVNGILNATNRVCMRGHVVYEYSAKSPAITLVFSWSVNVQTFFFLKRVLGVCGSVPLFCDSVFDRSHVRSNVLSM